MLHHEDARPGASRQSRAGRPGAAHSAAAELLSLEESAALRINFWTKPLMNARSSVSSAGSTSDFTTSPGPPTSIGLVSKGAVNAHPVESPIRYTDWGKAVGERGI